MQVEWSAGKKLVVSAAVVVVLSLVTGGVSWMVTHGLGSLLNQAVDVTARQQMLAGQISTAAADLESLERGLALAAMLQQTGTTDQLRRQVTVVEQEMRTQIASLGRLESRGRNRGELAKISSEFEVFGSTHQNVVQLMSSQKMDEAMTMLNSNLIPRLAEMNKSAKQLLLEESAELGKLSEEASRQRSASAWAIAVGSVLSIGVGLVLLFVVRSIYSVLQRTVRDLRENASQLAGAASQVSSSSQSVSQAASEQAASLEETSASSEEIHSMTRRNAEHAEQATRRTGEASGRILDANRALGQMVVSMNEISNSSNKISKIIKVIDDIAFQTNILALNAAVEAARAGEAGMGFAVVAEEVRNLAQRCAQAAKDTTELIEESIGRATEGKQKLDEVAAAIASVTESANNVKSLVEEVHGGSEQQARGIEQIARAVSRMEQVTQQLAATAQQGAAAGNELNTQAHTVDRIVSGLERLVGAQTGDDHAHPSRPSHRPNHPVSPKRQTPAHRGTGNHGTFREPAPIPAGARKSAEAMIPFDDDDFKEF